MKRAIATAPGEPTKRVEMSQKQEADILAWRERTAEKLAAEKSSKEAKQSVKSSLKTRKTGNVSRAEFNALLDVLGL